MSDGQSQVKKPQVRQDCDSTVFNGSDMGLGVSTIVSAVRDALDETPPERVAVIEIDESPNEAIWVSFSQRPSADIKVTLTGPHTAFLALDRQLRSEGNKRLTFSFDVEQERLSEPGGHSLDVLDFLQKDKSPLKYLRLTKTISFAFFGVFLPGDAGSVVECP